MSATRDNPLVWVDAPRLSDELLERLGDLYVRRTDLQEHFRSFEAFILWWADREFKNRCGILATTYQMGEA